MAEEEVLQEQFQTDFGTVRPIDVEKEMSTSYMDYAMSVIVSRALPDVRDGLKPVQRRILFSMYEQGMTPGSRFQKCAAIVGEVLKKWHPHGDSSVYDTLVRLAQSWNMRYPLIQGQGNFGCFTGDTKIKLLDGTAKTFKELSKLPPEEIFYVYSVNKAGEIVVGEGRNSRITHKKTTLVKVTLDNGSEIRCTPDHLFMLRDGNYRQAKELTSQTSLMPGYFDTMKIAPNSNDYLRVLQPNSAKYEWVHRIADCFNVESGVYSTPVNFFDRHHKDFDRFNNRPDNIIRLGHWEHLAYHRSFNQDPVMTELRMVGVRKYYQEHPEARQAITDRNNKLWSDPEFVKKQKAGLKKFFKEHPEAREAISKSSKELWTQEEYRNKYPDNHFSEMAKTLWADPKTIIAQREKALKQWKDEEFRTFMSEFQSERRKKEVAENPEQMKNMTAKAVISHLENWQHEEYKQQVLRSKIANYINKLISKYSENQITIEVYEENRKKDGTPTYKNALKYYDGLPQMVEAGKNYNHKVISVEFIDKKEDVYDITVEEHHNFLIVGDDGKEASGVFVHNSNAGDRAAAYRYTEARLTLTAMGLLEDIDKETVDWKDNYSATELEPVCLPSTIPNLLLNGSTGIAVGMATNIPPHNLHEICKASTALIEDPELTTEDLMKYVKGPDFPTGGVIVGKEGIKSAYGSGHGKITVRAKVDFEESKSGREQIIVNELPYMVNESSVVEKIVELVENRKIDGIADIREETDRDGLRIVIELKRDAQPQIVLNNLYKYTAMQSTFGANMLALVEGRPLVLNLKAILQYHIDWRRLVITRRTEYELKKAKARAHILEGLVICLNNLDTVISTIRKAPNEETARRTLETVLKLTELQSEAVVALRLGRLTQMETGKIEAELSELRAKILDFEDILANISRVDQIIKDDLAELRKKFGDERKTEIKEGESISTDLELESLIPEEDVVVTLTNRGYIKRVPVKTYKSQRRGGKGLTGAKTKEEDYVEHLCIASTHSDLLFFTASGKVYRIRTRETPDVSRTAGGTPVVNLIEKEPKDRVTAMLAVGEWKDDQFLLTATVNGMVKKTSASEFKSVMRTGKVAMTLKGDDELRWAVLTSGKDELIYATTDGKAIRFNEEDVRPMGRDSMGVIGLKLRTGAKAAGLEVYQEGARVLVVSENAYGKVTKLSEYPLQNRGGQGVVTFTVGDKTGNVVGIDVVEDMSEELMIITTQGMIIRTPLSELREMGRPSIGVIIMRLSKDDQVGSIAGVGNRDAEE